MGNAGCVKTHDTLSRGRAIALLAASSLAGACSRKRGTGVAIGSKNFTEQLVLGELYAQALEKSGLEIERKLNLGGTQIAQEALLRGDIDLYPEYTGTALVNVLHEKPGGDDADVYRAVKAYYAKHFDLTWLAPAPMNDTQALATTQALAGRMHLRTLTQLSAAAPQLRLGAIPEFTKRDDGLPGLQRAYGGFHFKDVKLFDIGLKYKALESGNVDVVVAFGTDGEIEADDLVVFEDDKHFWPTYRVAPVVRASTLRQHRQIASTLNSLSPLLTDAVMRKLNELVDGEKREPADVAHEFLAAAGFA
jgi:osmoprotectant transport system substrate-binding protein